MATQVTIDQPTQAPGAELDIHGLGRFLNGEARVVTEEQIHRFIANQVVDEETHVIHSKVVPLFESFEEAIESIHGDNKVEEVADND